MSRKTDLERAIRESYGIIKGYEDILRTSDRPEEKARARRVLDEQWALVKGCLAEYQPLVGGALPDEIGQIAARFSALAELSMVEQALDAQEALRGVLPDGQLEALLSPVKERQASLRAELWGSGAIAQGRDAQAVGERGIGAREFQGVAVTGDHNMVILASEAAAAFWRQFAGLHPVGPQASKAELEQATARYLELLLDRYRYLDFKGMGVSDRVPLRLPLVEMYVPLKARVELPEGETWTRTLRLAGRAVGEEEVEAIGRRLSEPTPALDLLHRYDGLIVLGDPGAGKTTFLKYMALRLAAGEGQALGIGSRLPILIPLSAYAAALSEQDVPLVQFIAAYCCYRGMDLPVQAMLQEALAQGGALLLLDGLDEVRDLSRRHLVVERVVDCFVAHRAQGNKFVLTSRVVGYREVRPVCEGLIECTLVDFGQDEIEAFVAKWTAALERAARGDTPLATLEAERERRELLEAVQRNPGVRDLAANPLLLTVLALMKRQGVTLPERRVQLYDQYVQTLLSSWNRARGLGRPPARDLDVVETMRILAPLALWMHQVSPGVGLVRQGDLQRQLEEVYHARGEADPERAARRFLEDVRGYAGLLLERGAGQYGFIHLTFEEYLAAVGIARLGQREIAPIVRTLSEHVGDPAWREVALLTVGYLGIVQQWEEVASDVVTALLDRRPGEPGQAAVWVGDAVVDAWPGGVTPGCKEGVIQALIQVMADDERVQPAQRALAGDTLARLGDPRPGVGLRADGLPDIAWCEVPEGPFWMDDRGQRTLPTFWIGKYPITVAQYTAFVEDEGYTDRWRSCWTDAGWSWKGDQAGPETYGGVFDLPNHPVVGVTWYEAVTYCRWLTGRLRAAGLLGIDQEIALPGEEQWVKAARGTDRRVYPWGDEPDPNRANYAETGVGATSAVGCFPGGASVYGCEEMSGNVWEWCATQVSGARVVRGGAFLSDAWYVRCAYRSSDLPVRWGGDWGFRVVVCPGFPSGL